ncbi:MAG: folylpolyglutamate synthase/dihydrofolate synthase family protein [Rhizobiaceae bacterium]
MSGGHNKKKTSEELIEALMANHPKGYDLSLGRITSLLEKLGNPQHKLPPVIHVAGTNGKGSAIAFTRAILEAAGLLVHVHTSPHLVNWHERYRMGAKGGGQLVKDAVLADAIARVAKANDGEPITVFEVLTVVIFLLFSENPADVCLIEVGLGGRFDATNVMEKTALTIITPISIDHESYLGDTLAKIAFEKAGIIKQQTPVIVGPQEEEALAVIEQQGVKNSAPLTIAGQDFDGHSVNGRMIFQDENCLLDLDIPKLPGEHQISNAATAIAAARCFSNISGMNLTTPMIDEGLSKADWPGRMQKITKGKLLDSVPKGCEVWLDGGHNPGAATMVANFLEIMNRANPRPVIMICGMLNTKDPAGYFDELSSQVDQLLAVPILSSDAGITPVELAKIARKSGLAATHCLSLPQALGKIKEKKDCIILIAGSLYLVGDALAQNDTPPI